MHPARARLLIWTVLVALVMAVMPGAATAATTGGGGGGARVVAEEKVGPRLLDLTVSSPALGRTAKVRLLTPDGWNKHRKDRRWPVLYLLHGCCDSYDSWTRETDVAKLAQLRDVLVVMPEGGPVGWYSDWWNHGKGGPPAWETFHLGELRPLLEDDYGAGTRRVVAGLSMGGLGSLLYAAHRPGMFRAAASYSGVVHPLHGDFPAGLLDLLKEYGEDPLAMWGDPVAQRAVWEAHDPYYLAGRLRSLPVFLSSGDGTAGPFDPPGTYDDLEAVLNEMNHAVADRLKAAGAHVTTDFYGPGTHDWPYWQRELHRSLPMLLRALNR